MSKPFHPADYLRKYYLDYFKISAAKLAHALDISEPEVNLILNKQVPITEAIAEKLAITFNTSELVWINLQKNYDNYIKNSRIKLGIKLINVDAKIPEYRTNGAAGFDLFSIETVHLLRNKPTLVKTGIALEIPEGYEVQIRSRSGLSLKGIHVFNSPGTIDSDYRGEIGVILNLVTGYEAIIDKHSAVAQGVLAKVDIADFGLTDELSHTLRGDRGFGSTDIGE